MPIVIPEPPFSEETADAIRLRMFDSMVSDLDIAEGSMAWNLISPAAIEVAALYAAMSLGVQLSFLQETYGKYLDARAEEHGATRLPASFAVGSVVFTGDDDSVIPAGTLVATTVLSSSDVPQVFTTLEEGIILYGEAEVLVRATTATAAGNVPVGAIDRVLSTIVGIDGVSNPLPLTGGSDLESDDALRERVLIIVSSVRGAGTEDDYVIWAREVPGIAWASCVPLADGPGTVLLLVLGPNNVLVTGDLLDTVIAYIEARRPIGADVTVQSPTLVTVDVSANLTMESGIPESAVQSLVEEEVGAYFASLGAGDDVRINEVGAAILSVAGVLDYASLQLEGAGTNFAVADDELGILGTVALS